MTLGAPAMPIVTDVLVTDVAPVEGAHVDH